MVLSCVAGATVLAACSAGPSDTMFEPAGGGAGTGVGGGGGGFIELGGAGGGGIIDGSVENPTDDCAESAKKIYLVTEENYLYSFNPDTPGMAAYKKIGMLKCNSSSTPQSMSVDRAGKAYVFYSSGDLYLVDTSNASCTPTNYSHPAPSALSYQLGMGFTADAPSSSGQILYIQSPDFGLATIDTGSFAVSKKGVFKGVAAELTGGPDAKLFRFEASTTQLVEVEQGSWKLSTIHKFNLSDVYAWAFSRYAGKFYVYTASSGAWSDEPSRTTVYDPDTDTESTRDADLGMTVVGAGQSTCVPPPTPK